MNDSAVEQNEQRTVDPRTVEDMINPLRFTEEPGTEPMLTGDDNAGLLLNDENDTYTIEESKHKLTKTADLKKLMDDLLWVLIGGFI